MLVLYLAKHLLHDVLQGDEAAGAAELVYDDGEAYLLLQQTLHELGGRHGLGDEGDDADIGRPRLADAEELGGVDVADDVVDVSVVDDNLGAAALDKLLTELFEGGVLLYGVYLGTRYHAVAYFGVGEVEGILEYLHLVLHIFLLRGVVDTLRDEVV